MPRLRGHSKFVKEHPRIGTAHRMVDDSPETRIGQAVKVQPNGCWLFNGKTDRYGQAVLRGKTVAVHRFVYETLVGPIPAGHHLHHECVTPGCCNPAHLLPLTPAEHKRRHAEMRRASAQAPVNPIAVRLLAASPDS